MNITVHATAASRRSAKKLAAKLHAHVRGQRRQTLVAYKVGNDFGVVKATNEGWWNGLNGVTSVAVCRRHGGRTPLVWSWHDVEVV